MASSLSWIDFCEADRRRALDVIDLFSEHETRDELGLASIRDAIADQLFPGTSTIQTRARYFLFVPWIYLALERKRVSSGEIARRARTLEVELIDALGSSDDTEGVIGIKARAGLKRLPSSVYWNGLGLWGLRVFPGDQDSYHRSLDRFYQQLTRMRRDDDQDITAPQVRNWHRGLPIAPDGFPSGATFQLRFVEADYLRERILTGFPKTMLALLLDLPREREGSEFPWQHVRLADFPPHINALLRHAQNFADVMHGSALLYNLMLAEKRNDSDLMQDYRDTMVEWADEIRHAIHLLGRWDRDRFWQLIESEGARIPPSTRAFVETWCRLVLSHEDYRRVSEIQEARQLIQHRERMLKGSQSRLDNLRALELWNGAAGITKIEYRWRKTQAIVGDILRGLKGE